MLFQIGDTFGVDPVVLASELGQPVVTWQDDDLEAGIVQVPLVAVEGNLVPVKAEHAAFGVCLDLLEWSERALIRREEAGVVLVGALVVLDLEVLAFAVLLRSDARKQLDVPGVVFNLSGEVVLECEGHLEVLLLRHKVVVFVEDVFL